MQIQQILTSQIEKIRPDMTLREAAAKMRDLDCGALPVCEGDRVKGIITDRDIVVRAVADGGNLDETAVRQVMTKDIACCFVDQDIAEAARIMSDRQVRRLPVLNRRNKVVGILSLGDLALEGSDTLAAEALKRVSEPSY
jgi:CBS domain-containing protein